MKIFYFILFIFLAAACKNERTSEAVDQHKRSSVENFDWLSGKWQRSNEKKDRETIEIWSKKDTNEYIGRGFTLQNNDTIWKEDLRLVKTNSNWNYEATGEGENNPTIFKITAIEPENFVAENEDNEFPKVIEYYLKENKLHALILGGSMEILFEFEKLNQ